jgi:hypothetical protein
MAVAASRLEIVVNPDPPAYAGGYVRSPLRGYDFD